MTNPNPDLRKKVVEAALKLAGTRGWSAVTLSDIARALKMKPEHLLSQYKDKTDILIAITEAINQSVLKTVKKADLKTAQDLPPHERLFEIMMARFDYLQTQREAFLSILRAVKSDPKKSGKLFYAQISVAEVTLSHAGLGTTGLKSQAMILGLLTIYGITLYVWERDNSKDMSKTMAVLDRHLRRAGKLAELIFPLSPDK